MCEFNMYVIHASVCTHPTFTSRKNGPFRETKCCFFRFAKAELFSPRLSQHLLEGHCWDGSGGTRSLPAVRGWQQQQQLSGRDTEQTAPSRRVHTASLLLAALCAWCCLLGLEMAVADHLEQGQTCVVSHREQGRASIAVLSLHTE